MRGLVVGRFQPLHHGHLQLIKQAMEHCGDAVVAIGSSTEAVSWRNPFTFEERAEMLRLCFPNLQVVGIPDIHNPPRYAAHCVELTGPITDVFGNDNSTMDLFEDDGFRIHRPGLKQRTEWEGAAIRAALAEDDKEWHKAVPKPVADYLDRIEASKRLARLGDA